jgi:hypothetical protein
VRGFGFDRNWLGLGGSYVGGWRRGGINVTLLYFGVGLGGVESLLCRLWAKGGVIYGPLHVHGGHS